MFLKDLARILYDNDWKKSALFIFKNLDVSLSNYYLGKYYYENEDWKKAYCHLLKSDEVESYNWLGELYFNGNYVDVDETKAYEMYQMGASYGDQIAQLNLSYLLKDEKKSFYWMEKSAKQGYSDAQYEMGEFYREKKDVKEALYWYELASKQDNDEAQYRLGEYYYTKNLNRSFYYLNQAYLNGNQDCLYYLAECYWGGDGVGKDLERAMYFYEKSSDYGNLDAKYRCGLYYLGEKEYDIAFDYFKDLERPDAIYRFGLLYAGGLGVKQDWNKAFECFKKCPENSGSELADCYYYGNGTEKDWKRALDLYLECDDEDEEEVWLNLGNIYFFNGNEEKAIEYYKKCENNKALLNLIYLYSSRDVNQDQIRELMEDSGTEFKDLLIWMILEKKLG